MVREAERAAELWKPRAEQERLPGWVWVRGGVPPVAESRAAKEQAGGGGRRVFGAEGTAFTKPRGYVPMARGTQWGREEVSPKEVSVDMRLELGVEGWRGLEPVQEGEFNAANSGESRKL